MASTLGDFGCGDGTLGSFGGPTLGDFGCGTPVPTPRSEGCAVAPSSGRLAGVTAATSRVCAAPTLGAYGNRRTP